MKYPKLPNAVNSYGASMGREDFTPEPSAKIKFRLYRMLMVNYAYDSGGAYWGGGGKYGVMYHAYGEGPEHVNEMFMRTKTRDEAKAEVLRVFPNATFWR